MQNLCFSFTFPSNCRHWDHSDWVMRQVVLELRKSKLICRLFLPSSLWKKKYVELGNQKVIQQCRLFNCAFNNKFNLSARSSLHRWDVCITKHRKWTRGKQETASTEDVLSLSVVMFRQMGELALGQKIIRQSVFKPKHNDGSSSFFTFSDR